jgi:hypothetical protein
MGREEGEMKGVLAGVALLAIAGSAFGQGPTVRGVELGITCTLIDPELNPDGVTLDWVQSSRGDYYEGKDDAGRIYRLSLSQDEWGIRLIIPQGDFALAWMAVDAEGTRPIRFRGPRGGGAGPLVRLYGDLGWLDITIRP